MASLISKNFISVAVVALSRAFRKENCVRPSYLLPSISDYLFTELPCIPQLPVSFFHSLISFYFGRWISAISLIHRWPRGISLNKSDFKIQAWKCKTNKVLYPKYVSQPVPLYAYAHEWFQYNQLTQLNPLSSASLEKSFRKIFKFLGENIFSSPFVSSDCASPEGNTDWQAISTSMTIAINCVSFLV